MSNFESRKNGGKFPFSPISFYGPIILAKGMI